MGWGFSIDRASADQADIVAGLVSKLLNEVGHELIKQQSEQDIIESTRAMLADDKIIAFIAKNDQQEPVGVVTLHQCSAIYAGGTFGELSELYVDREYRSGTVGHGLLNTAVQYAASRAGSVLAVGLPDANQWSRTLSFYKSCGFVEIGPKLKLELK